MLQKDTTKPKYLAAVWVFEDVWDKKTPHYHSAKDVCFCHGHPPCSLFLANMVVKLDYRHCTMGCCHQTRQVCGGVHGGGFAYSQIKLECTLLFWMYTLDSLYIQFPHLLIQ